MSGGGGGSIGPGGAGGATDIGVRCGLCNSSSEPVGDDAIVCDKCSASYHPTPACTGMNKNVIKALQKEGLNGALRYCCSKCRCLTNPGSGNTPADQSQAMSQMFTMIKALSENLVTLTAQVSALASNGRTVQAAQQPAVPRESLYAELREFNEIDKRKESIIVRGSKARNDDEFKSVFAQVSRVLTGSEICPDQVYCINRQTCMYRATIKQRDLRQRLLSEAKNLRNTEMRGIYLSRDLTFRQRAEQRAKRAASRNNRPTEQQPTPSLPTLGAHPPQQTASSPLPPGLLDDSGGVSPSFAGF